MAYSVLYHMYADHGFVHAVMLAEFEGRNLVCLQGWRPESGENRGVLLYEQSPWHGSWKAYAFGDQLWIKVKMNWQGRDNALREHWWPMASFRRYGVIERRNRGMLSDEAEWLIV